MLKILLTTQNVFVGVYFSNLIEDEEIIFLWKVKVKIFSSILVDGIYRIKPQVY